MLIIILPLLPHLILISKFLPENLLYQVLVPLLYILFFCLFIYSQLPLLYGHPRDHGLVSVIARVRNNGVQSSIVQLLSHCFASLSLHGILIDQGDNDPLKIRQKKSVRKSTYSRTFSKIIIKQQLQWLPARVRYCRINIFKTVFKYSFVIS